LTHTNKYVIIVSIEEIVEMIKKSLEIIFVLSICIFSSCAFPIPRNEPTPQYGSAPQSYHGNVLEKQLLLRAAEVPDGYLLAEGGAVEKYDKAGKLLWNKSYKIFEDTDRYCRNVIRPFSDGSFVISFSMETYYNSNGERITFEPILIKCDKNGNLFWKHTFENYSDETVTHVFETGSGDILTVGFGNENYTPENNVTHDVCLFLFSQNGQIKKSVKYGGSDIDWVSGADYIAGKGLIVKIYSQSTDGTFAASYGGNGRYILSLIDDGLNIVWYKNLSFNSFIAADKAIYLLDLWNNYYKVDYSGNILFEEAIAERLVFARFIGYCPLGQVLQIAGEIIFYDDLEVKLTIAFDAGNAEKIIETADGFIIVSINVTGTIPSPPYISSLWYSSDIVYSAYDRNGDPVWRISHDITPRAWYDYQTTKDT